jgi:hypothetical protein
MYFETTSQQDTKELKRNTADEPESAAAVPMPTACAVRIESGVSAILKGLLVCGLMMCL